MAKPKKFWRLLISKMKIKFYFLSPFALSNWVTNYWDRIVVSLYNSEKVELYSWSGFADNDFVGMIMLLIITHSSILILFLHVPSFDCTSFWEDPKNLFFYFSLPNDYFSCHISKKASLPPGINTAYLSALYFFLVPLASLYFWSSFKWHLFHIS